MEDTSEMLGFVLHGANMAALTLLQWSTGIHLEHTNTVLLGDAWMRFIVSIRTQIHYYNYNLYTEYYTIIYIIFILYLYYNLYNYNFTQNLSSFLRSDLFPPPKPEVIGLIHTFQLLVLSHNNSPSLSWIILDSLSIHKQRIEKQKKWEKLLPFLNSCGQTTVCSTRSDQRQTQASVCVLGEAVSGYKMWYNASQNPPYVPTSQPWISHMPYKISSCFVFAFPNYFPVRTVLAINAKTVYLADIPPSQLTLLTKLLPFLQLCTWNNLGNKGRGYL